MGEYNRKLISQKQLQDFHFSACTVWKLDLKATSMVKLKNWKQRISLGGCIGSNQTELTQLQFVNV